MNVLCSILALVVHYYLIREIGAGSRKSNPKYNKRHLGCPDSLGCRCSTDDMVEGGFAANCRYLNLSRFPDNFGDQSHWTNIDVSSNRIERIEGNNFNNVHRVETLILSYNRICEIQPDSFKKLHNLQDLELESNQLEYLPPFIFTDSPNIDKLVLSSNRISNLSADSFSGLHNLKLLTLDDNYLGEFPAEALRHTVKLEFLSLSVNRIEFLPNDAFALLKNLKILNLRENRISSMGNTAMDTIVNCIELDLSFNYLTQYPLTVMRLKKLERLSINNNQIAHLPDRAFSKQTELTMLNIRDNPLPFVGRWTFSELPHLTSLVISNVKEQKYFPQFAKCNRLESLSITGGRFHIVPQSLCSCNSSLVRLDISDNQLYDLDGLEACSVLEELDASNNVISSLGSDAIKNLISLRILDLSNNFIKTLDSNSFENMKLEQLSLANNPLSELPGKGLNGVRILDISNTENLFFLPPMSSMNRLEHLEATYAYHCCQLFSQVVDKSKEDNDRPYVTCFPQSTVLTPCRAELLKPTYLRVFLYLVTILSFLVNFLIIALSVRRNFFLSPSLASTRRKTTNDVATLRRRVLSESRARNVGNVKTFDVLLCHLAVTDFIATMYLATIMIFDVHSDGHFLEVAAWWQESPYCKAAGFFLVVGMQLCFYTIFVATIERYLTTMYPLNPEKHLKKQVLVLALSSVWVISIATGIVTLHSKSKDSPLSKSSPLPPHNGALCLPWSTDFFYVALLVGFHVLISAVVVVLCALMYCSKRKQSWLSTQKHTRFQTTVTVSCNLFCILPLAAIGLLTSAISTYPSALEPWMASKSEVSVNDEALNINLLLAITLTFIVIRFLINPIIHTCFCKEFRLDVVNLARAVCRLTKFHWKLTHRKLSLEGNGDESAATDDRVGYCWQPSESFANLPVGSMNPDPICVPVLEEDVNNQFILSCLPSRHDRADYLTDEGRSLDSSDFFLRDNDDAIYPRDNFFSSYDGDSEESDDAVVQPMKVLKDFERDPFLLSSRNFYPNEEDREIECRKGNEIASSDGTDTPSPLHCAKTFRTNALTWSSVLAEEKGAKTLLVRQKQPRTDPNDPEQKAQMTSHSSESSTSKDSGIQSEPDFGTIAHESSASSTLSRAKQNVERGKSAVPVFLIPPKLVANRDNSRKRTSIDERGDEKKRNLCLNSQDILSPSTLQNVPRETVL